MNIIEISENFPTELDAVKYFEQIRWGETPYAPIVVLQDFQSLVRIYGLNVMNVVSQHR